MSSPDVVRRLDELERRVGNVELAASPDTMSNNFVVVNADGTVTVVFNGKIIAHELDLSLALGNVNNVNKVRWLRDSDGAEGAYLAANALAGDGGAGTDYSGFLQAVAESVGATRQAQVTAQSLSNFDSLSGSLLRVFSAPGNALGRRHVAYAETESDLGGAVFDNILLDGAGNLSGMRCISDTILGAPSAQVDISLPTDANGPPHALIVTTTETTSAADQTMFARFNGDSGANYRYQTVFGQGVSAGAQWDGGAATSLIQIGGAINATTNSNFGCNIIFLPNYLDTQRYQPIISLVSLLGINFSTQVNSGMWQNAAAISTVSLILSGGTSFAVPSRFTTYLLGSRVN